MAYKTVFGSKLLVYETSIQRGFFVVFFFKVRSGICGRILCFFSSESTSTWTILVPIWWFYLCYNVPLSCLVNVVTVNAFSPQSDSIHVVWVHCGLKNGSVSDGVALGSPKSPSVGPAKPPVINFDPEVCRLWMNTRTTMIIQKKKLTHTAVWMVQNHTLIMTWNLV